MQTSFMHPPFGFALFYLRGIADTLYKDKRIEKPIKSNDIYMGAIPWVLMQLLLVGIVIFFPQTVTVFLDKEQKIDLDKVKIEAPTEDYGNTAPPAFPSASGTDATPATPATDDNDQKKIDELFNQKK
jgi:hypothetical protein